MENNALFDSKYPIKIGNQELRCSYLTDKDYGDLDGYIKAKYVQLAFKVANSGHLTDVEAIEYKSIAVSNSLKTGWATVEGNDIIWSEDGILHIGYQLIRKEHAAKYNFATFEKLCRGRKDENGQYPELLFAIEQILLAWKFFNPEKEKKEEDVGGSSTGSEKS